MKYKATGRPIKDKSGHRPPGPGKSYRSSNRRLLCPNCHSQSPKYGPRNMRRAKKQTVP